MSLTFCEQLIASATARPGKIAMTRLGATGNESTTFGSMLDQIRSIAWRLEKEGINFGDRVALMGENHPQWAMIYLGILYRGAVVVPLDPAGMIETITAFVENSEAKRAFIAYGSLDKFRAVCDRIGKSIPTVAFGVIDPAQAEKNHHELYSDWAGTPRPEGFDDAKPPAKNSDMAILIYTSGTTGVPKAVPLTHGNIVSETGAVEESMGFTEKEIILSLLPLFHAYSQIVNLWIATLIGASVIYITELSSEEILRGLKEGRVTALTGVPRLWYLFHKKIFDGVRTQPMLVRKLFSWMMGANGFLRDRLGINAGRLFFRKVHEAFGGNLRIAASGGSSFDAEVARDFHKLGFTMLQAYGLTETSGAATVTRFEDNRVGSVGKPLPNVEVKIDEPNEEGIGEVLIRGPIVMPGYYRNPEANSEAFTEDGWFRSGDLGRYDADGHLYITGRKKDIIVLPSGKNVYPEEVEAQYSRTPLVSEVCVLGVHDPESHFKGAEKLVAVVVPDFEYMKSRNITNSRQEITFALDSLGRELPEYQRVRDYIIRAEALPRTATRKIRRFEVLRLIKAEGASQFETRDLSQFKLTEADRSYLNSTAGRAVLAVISSHLKQQIEIHPKMNLELDLGLDSLTRAECIVGLEHLLGIEFDQERAATALTVGEWVEMAGSLRAEDESVQATEQAAGINWSAILKTASADMPDLQPILKRKPLMFWFAYLVLRPIYWLARIFLRMEVQGIEQLSKMKPPFLVCPNHQSFVDAFLVCSTYPRPVLKNIFHVGSKMYFEGSFMSWLGPAINVVPVDANVNLVNAMRAGAGGLRAGKILNIYPEGHRTFDGMLHEFKQGAAILATELNLPIVPVALDGAYKVLPRDSSRIRLAKVKIRFGRPIYPTGDYQALTDELKGSIQRMLDEGRESTKQTK
jgi:long-chain acyl-CoA synthetase